MKSPCGGHTAAPHGALAFCGGLRRTGEGKGGSENQTQGDVGMVLGWFWACFCFSGPTWDRRSFLQAPILGPWVLARKHNLGPCPAFFCSIALRGIFSEGLRCRFPYSAGVFSKPTRVWQGPMLLIFCLGRPAAVIRSPLPGARKKISADLRRELRFFFLEFSG